jgi:Putative zinc finger motif, C2HC5-type
MAQSPWALTQIRKLLPLDDDSLKQILDYSSTLSKDGAAEHLKNLLGDSPQALEFISSFNSKRQAPPTIFQPTVTPADDNGLPPPVPKAKQRKKKESAFNKLPPPRQVESYGDTPGAYLKRAEDDYITGRRDSSREPKRSTPQHSRNHSADMRHSEEKISVTPPGPSQSPAPKLPPSASGRLISDLKKPPASSSKTIKASVTGGLPMKGKSTALSDLDVVIRNLEIQTNPSLAPTAEENARRKCNCMATRHELLTAAPNCMNCGKIICVKEGLGPCTFCGNPLLSPSELQSMIRVLREESGREKMAANNAVHKRAEVSKAPRPFSDSHHSSPGTSAPPSDSESDKLAAAKQHRDKLLAFQSQNARRTRVHDEAADFDTPVAGQNMWATPMERAMELKRQQKALREQEWRARPDWEKRKIVASIDLIGGKIVRHMATAERPASPESEEDDSPLPPVQDVTATSFGRNPLMGSLIRPIAKVQAKGKTKASKDRGTKWRRVQDNNDDNERWILDGGISGAGLDDNHSTEEPPCG